MTVVVPTRNGKGFGNESGGRNSPSTSPSFRSPVSRILSFKRILSRERKGSMSPSSCSDGGCSFSAELIDEERGGGGCNSPAELLMQSEVERGDLVSFSEFRNRSRLAV